MPHELSNFLFIVRSRINSISRINGRIKQFLNTNVPLHHKRNKQVQNLLYNTSRIQSWSQSGSNVALLEGKQRSIHAFIFTCLQGTVRGYFAFSLSPCTCLCMQPENIKHIVRLHSKQADCTVTKNT